MRTPLPVVFVNMGRSVLAKRSAPSAFIFNDNAAIGRLAAATFLKNGLFASIAFVPWTCSDWNVARGAAFREALERAGMTCVKFQSEACPDTPCMDHDGLVAFLSSLLKPTAVYAANDECAIHVLAAATAAGIRVPEQMALLGTDNDEFLVRHSIPPISSIQPGSVKSGFRAAKEMDALLRGCPGPKNPIYIPPVNVIERTSTTPVLPVTTLIRRAKAFIEAHACERIGVADIVRHLGVSRRLAELRFRQIEGTTLRRALEARRIEEAKRLLRKKKLSVTEVARRCGFPGQNRLCHVFTERVGTSPSHYRLSANPGTIRRRAPWP